METCALRSVNLRLRVAFCARLPVVLGVCERRLCARRGGGVGAGRGDSVRSQRVGYPPLMWANPWGFWRSVGSVGVSRMILAIPAAIGSVAVGLQGITCYGVAWWRRDDLRQLNNSLRAHRLPRSCAIGRTD